MRIRLLIAALVGVIIVVSGCAGVPNSSAPQAIGTVELPPPKQLPEPNASMTPEQTLREFLKATADPADRRAAARQFLTESASKEWDDAGSALLIDKVVFVETSSLDKVSVTMQADILGSLSDIGVFETGEGQLPDPGPIELVRTANGWRINRLPNGVFLDWQQFQSAYKRSTLYFVDPTGKTVVPDPRYLAVSDPDQLPTELVAKLIAGPRPEMANAVRNLLGPPVKLRGPVSRADGSKTGVGRGYGGARVDLENLTTTDPASRLLHLRRNWIWTFARADIKGPYLIDVDGAALDDRFVDGGRPPMSPPLIPGAVDGATAGVHALIGGSLVALDGQGSAKVPGSFGMMVDQRAAAFSGPAAMGWWSRHRWRGSLWIDRRWAGGAGDRLKMLTRPSWALDDVGCRRRQQRGAVVRRRLPASRPHSGGFGRGHLPVPRGDRRSATHPGRHPGGDGDRGRGGAGRCHEQAPGGEFALTYPRRIGFGLGDSVVALSWRTGDDMVVTRNDPAHPVSYVNLDGVNSDGPSTNLVMPVAAVAADPSAVYVSDARGILQLLSTSGAGAQEWSELRGFMVAGAVPVLPG